VGTGLRGGECIAPKTEAAVKNHGCLYQYHELFVEHANQLLSWTLQEAESLPQFERLPLPALAPGEGDDD